MSRINNQFSVGVHIMTALDDYYGEQVTSKKLTASVKAHESQVRHVIELFLKTRYLTYESGSLKINNNKF